MFVRIRSLRFVFLTAAVAALLLAPLSAFAQGPSPIQVVASGLNNPRGIAFAPNGMLYVAEAGTGQNDAAITGFDLKQGTKSTLASGLPSEIGGEGDVLGVHDVSFQGRGNLYAPIGLGADPATRAAGSRFGWLLKAPAGGKVQYRADVAGYENPANPDGGEFDSNPYSVQALPDGMALVADAGANALLKVNVESGAVSALAVFPDRLVPVDPAAQAMFGLPPQMPAQAVPNAVTVGPDGAYYVGQLLGFPFTPGQSNVFRVAPDGTYSVYRDGFTAIIDVTFDAQGNMYVLEIAKHGLIAALVGGDLTGALIKVAPDGTRTEIASDGLVVPGGVAIGPDGAAYVTNRSTFSGTGEVVRIPLSLP